MRILFASLLFLSTLASGEEPTVRHEFKQGVYVSLLGDPGINLFGIDYAYWSSPNLRWNIGAGTIFFANTIGLGANYYVGNPAPFRAFVGTGLNLLSVSDFHESSFYSYNSIIVFYQNFKMGVEYAAEGGFFIDLHLAAFLFFSGDPEHTLSFNPVSEHPRTLYII